MDFKRSRSDSRRPAWSSKEENTPKWIRERYLQGGRRWLRTRLPGRLLQNFDVDQSVSQAFLEALGSPSPQERGEACFQLCLRSKLESIVKDLASQVVDAQTETLDPQRSLLMDELVSPLEQAVGQETSRRYEAALQQLPTSDREMIVGRIEFGFSYDELAAMTGHDSPESAKEAVVQAVRKLTEAMCDDA